MKAGFYPASMLPMAAYLVDPCDEPSLSSGAAHKLLTRSPAHVHAEHPRFGNHRDDDSNASDMGTVAHDLILGGESKICVIDPQEYRSKPTKDNPEGSIPVGYTNNAIREARDRARELGLTPILAGAYGAAKNMVDAVKSFVKTCELPTMFDAGEGECTMLWQDGIGADAVWCRARPDWVNHEARIMVHLKTTKASANPEPFIRMADAMGYDVSLAFYRWGFETLTEQKDFLHVILAVEQDYPHACSLIGLDPAKWAIADEKVRRAVEIWRRCVRSNQWPAYSGEIHYATPTAWQLAEAEALLQE